MSEAYKEIPLTQGKVAKVDPIDYEFLSQWKWCAHLDRSTGRFYAARMVTVGRKKQRYLSMHRFLMGQPRCKVDHHNRDGLDNRRNNLRKATNRENGANSKTHCHNSSGFRGVSYRKNMPKRPWHAYIGGAGKTMHLGFFTTAEEAARAYDSAAIARYGEFAVLNFPGAN